VAKVALAVELVAVELVALALAAGVAAAAALVTSVDKAVMAGVPLGYRLNPADKVARVMSSVKPRTFKITPVMVVPVDTPPTEATDTSIFPSIASKSQLIVREKLVDCTTLTPCAVSLYLVSE